MKKIAMTAACFALGGMLTAATAGDSCGKGKKCGGEDKESLTTVFCGGEKKCGGEDKESLSTVLLGDFTVYCGGEKKCGGGADKES